MAIDFPANPTNGQVYANYIYDSSITAWRNVNTDTGIGTLNAMGLKNVVPTSVNVGSGSATVNANGTVSFSSATSISLNGCFSSAYTNYRIIYIQDTGSSTTTDVVMRFRKNGSDNNSSTNYYYNGMAVDSASVGGFQQVPQASGFFYINQIHPGTNTHSSAIIEVQKPFTTRGKTYTVDSYGWTGAALYKRSVGGFNNDSANAFDGFSFFTMNGSTTFGGNITVYGYTN